MLNEMDVSEYHVSLALNVLPGILLSPGSFSKERTTLEILWHDNGALKDALYSGPYSVAQFGWYET